MSLIPGILDNLRIDNRLRTIPHPGDERLLDLSGNDYLGLAAHSDLYLEEFADFCPNPQFSSSASRLLSQRQNCHLALEDYLQSLYGNHALLYNSGYHANVGTVGALSALPGTLFIADKLIHASIIDGLKIAGSDFKRFPHNDIAKLTRILDKESTHYEHIVIIVESIYSMDGDEAPLKGLVELKAQYQNVMLYVDEAHGFGVRGKRGLGVCEELNLLHNVDLLIGTLGKAAASSGAFVICNEVMKSLLINFSRPFIFSTALPPVNVAWSHLMIEKIVQAEDLRKKLFELSSTFRTIVETETGIKTGSTSQIIPLVTGDAATALVLGATLRDRNVLALPIRRPTVPPGGERIRFSISASIDREEIAAAASVVASLFNNMRNS